MSDLKERVIVKTPTGDLDGTLFVGMDGLPEVRVTEDAVEGEVHQIFRPATFPACWVVMPPKGGQRGILLDAWREIEAIQERLKVAEREAEEDERDRAEQREIDARISQELVEGREGDNVDTTHAD